MVKRENFKHHFIVSKVLASKSSQVQWMGCGPGESKCLFMFLQYAAGSRAQFSSQICHIVYCTKFRPQV